MRRGTVKLQKARLDAACTAIVPLTWDRTLPRSNVAFTIPVVRFAGILRALTQSPFVGGGAVREAETTRSIRPQRT